MDLKKFMQDVHETAVKKGWWEEGKQATAIESHMLMVSELAEATEAYREGQAPLSIDREGKPLGEVSELADCIIRILDYCAYHNLPIITALVCKNEYNKTRSYRHGGKLK